jgi:hypothetical protein
MDRALLAGIATLLLGFLASCSTVQSRIQDDPQTFASLSPADQVLVRQRSIREGMSRSAVYLAWGRPDRVRYGSRAGVPFETWIYTTTRSEIVPGYYPTFYGLGYYQYGAPFYGYRGLYGYYPFGPSIWGDTLSYEVPYKTAFFERNRCTGWEYLR